MDLGRNTGSGFSRLKLGGSWKRGMTVAFVAASALAVACGTGTPASQDGEVVGHTAQALETTPFQFKISLPAGAPRALLSASNRLTLNGQGSVGKVGTLSAVAGFGTGSTLSIQAAAKIYASVYSGGPIQMGSGATIFGNAQSGGAITLQDTTAKVIGTRTPNSAPVPTLVSWTVNWPNVVGAPVVRNAGSSLPPVGNPGEQLTPGNYGAFNVGDRNRLTFRAGSYFFTSFDLANLAEIRIDSSLGPVTIYVRDTVRIAGRLLPAQNSSGVAIVPEGQVLLGYKGTSQVQLFGGFIGTLVAPSAEIQLPAPSNGGQHKGSFYGKDVTLDSNANLPIIPLDINLSDLTNDPSIPPDPGTPEPEIDSDGDKTPNRTDECPADPLKTKRGLCDCGVSDVDTDGDTVPDCFDEEDGNPVIQVTGVCSTASPGTTCKSFRCGDTTATCQANGECGNAAVDCNPGTKTGGASGTCFNVERDDSSYWFCTHAVSWNTAFAACTAVPGRNLALAEDKLENNWLGVVASFPAWTSVNRVSSNWFGAWGSAKNAVPLWLGGATGSAVAGAYTSWAQAQPGAGDCGYLADDGTWVAASCTTTRGFICEQSIGGGDDIDEPPHPTNGGGSGSACVDAPPGGAFPTSDTQFRSDVIACFACTAEPCAACTGDLSVPPATSTCPADPSEKADRCQLSTAWVASQTNFVDCNRASPACAAGQICGRIDVCPAGEECRKRFVCGVPDPLCAAFFVDDKPRCDEVNLCNPDLQVVGVTQAELLDQNGSNLKPKTLDPAALFPPPAPLSPTAKIPGAKPDGCGNQGEGSACQLGVTHPWCRANAKPPETNVPPGAAAVNPLADRQGKTGSSKAVSFDFDPNMTLDYRVNPGLYGDADLHMEASVSLGATVGFQNLLGISKTFDILDAFAGATIDRCNAGADAHLILLGHDFLPDLLTATQKAQLDALTKDSAFEEACSKAADDYLVELNKAHKAYRDAQEIARQFKQGVAAGKRFTQSFCGQLIQSRTPAGFGPIDCTTAAPHQVVNAFIAYAHKTLEELIAKSPYLSTSDSRLSGSFDFPVADKMESQTVANYPFAIGPVPMNLSVDITYGYGLSGSVGYQFTPGDALNVLRDLNPHQIARAYAKVEPYAMAGVELFVGIGFDFGPVAAKLGISGDVVLGEIHIPADAGAFLELQATKDEREVDSELSELVEDQHALVFPPNGASAFAFRSGFQVKVAANVDNILKGGLSAKLKIKFFFFSKTWRKQIVTFNGLGSLHFPIIDETPRLKGELGSVRMPFTFPRLRQVQPAPNPPGTGGSGGAGGAGGSGGAAGGGSGGTGGTGGSGGAAPAPGDFVFDKGRVETLFYNEECVPPVVQACPQIFATTGATYVPQIEYSTTPVAYGQNGMDLHDRVRLLSAQPGNALGDLAARSGLVTLRNDVVLGRGIGGDAYDIWARVSYTGIFRNALPPAFVNVPPIVLTAPPYPASFTEAGTINVNQGQTKNLQAGSYYDRVVVFEGGTLILNGQALSPGTPQEFFFNNLQVEPGAKVIVNHAQGAVNVVMRNSFAWKGELINGTGRANAHVFGYYGTTLVSMESLLGFKGTVVTPNASLVLNSRIYEGAFYGKFLEVHQGAQLTFSPCRGF